MTSVQTMLQSPDLSNLELHVNDGPLAPSDVTLLRQSRADEPLEELRHSYHNEGYLFSKGLLPRADVLKAREQYFSMIELSGVLKPGSNPVDGIFDPEKDKADFPGIGANAAGASGPARTTHPGDKLGQQFEDDFAKEAAVSGLSEEECKNAFNRDMMTTGFLANGPAGFARQHKSRWLLEAYEAGDLVFHKPHIIHASTIKQDPENRIKLGTDLRFVNASRPDDSRWCKPYTFEDGI
ncbi:Phytanoyl-hydroxylase [Lasiodiplodia theobromae]|uniref:Phytanoyl-hydroxylase n=1 Tax=Lasiodiplodia theobromae TaxID=45133 RepID=UPI0015C3DA4C|nr:Phytanoyl-hydroxylase [Lasiodiplodia theobromae]KAF4535024.1 Phytanoyl-hydroxylase [Lasiodiplodia theobromae]